MGYSIGYQGLLLPHRRFSISYGVNYVKTFTKHYDDSDFPNSMEPDKFRVGFQTTYQDFEIPISQRWNFIRKGKFEAYLSLAPVLMVPVKTKQDYILIDNSLEQMPVNYNRNFGVQMELGTGINYYVTEKFLINLYLSYHTANQGHLQV